MRLLILILFTSIQKAALPPVETCVALGMFDGLHLGHQAVINTAVRTARDENLFPCVFTFSALYSRPASKSSAVRLLSPRQRESLLGEMGVSYTLCPDFEEFRHLTPQQFVEDVLKAAMRARHVYCGENFRFGKGAAADAVQLKALCEAAGVQAHIQPMLRVDGELVSSTRIRGRILEGDIPTANRLLGRRFAIDFEVIHGRELGRTIDSPTINQPFPHQFVVPRFGVYASLAKVDGVRYPSVTNVGVKPTVGSEGILAETYIMGYKGDLYGRNILVEFLQFIRGEEQFSSVQELRENIQRDSETAANIARAYLQPAQ